VRQMACHPDLVLRSKTSVLVKDHVDNAVCRLCNDTVSFPLHFGRVLATS
jgi:DNA repair protein RAD16